MGVDLRWSLGLPYSSVGKESACNAGDPGLTPGLGRSAGEELGYPFQYSWASLMAQLVKNLPAMRETWVQSLGWEDTQGREGYPLQYSGLENSMDCIVQGIKKSWTPLSDFHFQDEACMPPQFLPIYIIFQRAVKVGYGSGFFLIYFN